MNLLSKYSKKEEEGKVEETNNSSKVYQMINDQINFEYYSLYVYHHLANVLDDMDFINVAEWFNKKGDEELQHARKFVKYLYDRNQKVSFKQIPQPNVKASTVKEAFEVALKHEKEVSKRITEIQSQAEKENDRLTYNFLNWFLVEQVEEEGVLNDYLSKLSLEPNLYMFDLEFQEK